jgi:hypothetical protein
MTMKYLGALIGTVIGTWIASTWIVHQLALKRLLEVFTQPDGTTHAERAILAANALKNSHMTSLWTYILPTVLGITVGYLCSGQDKEKAIRGGMLALIAAIGAALLLGFLWGDLRVGG